MKMRKRHVHPLVRVLIEDPAQPPDLVVLNGFIGESEGTGQVRLYLNPSMNAWVDIPGKYVVLFDRLPAGPGAPWGEDVLWISRRNARKLTRKTSVSKDGDTNGAGGDGWGGPWESSQWPP
jgi:hypothetical protein